MTATNPSQAGKLPRSAGSRFCRIAAKTLKYTFYFILFYFAWEGFMNWR